MKNFHEIRFPTEISRNSHGGPERRTDVVALGSGFEERNARWADSRRSYNAGYGVRSIDDLYAIIEFFEERRGRLYGFRWKDHTDYKSCSPERAVLPVDQSLGMGDGEMATFQLAKVYGRAFAPWSRVIAKPVAATTRVAVGGVEVATNKYEIDTTTGQITFKAGSIPQAGQTVSAGFEFDVPVRFDTDKLEINLQAFRYGSIPAIQIVEVHP